MNRAWTWGSLVAAVMLASVTVPAAPPDASAERMRSLRERMAVEDIAAGGVTDPRVLKSMRTTLRHEFVPPPQRHLAYVDMALPIGEKQTISGPFVVAYMTERLEPRSTDRVLEIGTGSGYQAAVLSPLVKTVYSIEINKPLGEKAARILARLGYKNVITKIGDGFQGWPEHAPFDKIIVTCSPEEIPEPLVDQLAEGGRMVIPVGERYDQMLVLLTKRDGEMVRESLVPSLFVPMTGEAEEARVVQPDGTRPAIGTGGFEDLLPGQGAISVYTDGKWNCRGARRRGGGTLPAPGECREGEARPTLPGVCGRWSCDRPAGGFARGPWRIAPRGIFSGGTAGPRRSILRRTAEPVVAGAAAGGEGDVSLEALRGDHDGARLGPGGDRPGGDARGNRQARGG